MRKQDQEILLNETDYNKILIHSIYFDDLYDLVKYIKETPIANYWKSKKLASIRGDYDFTKTKSLEEALNLCLSPEIEMNKFYFEGIRNVVGGLDILTKKRRMEYNFCGSYVSVPRYLSGNPRSMKRVQRVTEKSLIKVYLNSAYPWYMKESKIRYRGMCVMILIQWLQQLGYIVEFNFFEASVKKSDEFDSFSEIQLCNIKLKQAEELLDIRNTYFPICHPSFLRRIIFALHERTEYKLSGWSIGYGSACRDNLLKKILQIDEKSIVVNSFNFIVENDLMASMKNFIEYYNLEQILHKEDVVNLDEMKKVLQKKKYL